MIRNFVNIVTDRIAWNDIFTVEYIRGVGLCIMNKWHPVCPQKKKPATRHTSNTTGRIGIKFCIRRERIGNNEGNHVSLLGVQGGTLTLQIISGRTREVQRLMKVNSRSFVMAIIAKKTKIKYCIRILYHKDSNNHDEWKNRDNY